jgi:hypothetical protein
MVGWVADYLTTLYQEQKLFSIKRNEIYNELEWSNNFFKVQHETSIRLEQLTITVRTSENRVLEPVPIKYQTRYRSTRPL